MAFPNQQVPNQMLAKTPQGLGSLNPTAPQQNAYQVTPEMGRQTNMPGGFGGQGGFNQPQMQQKQPLIGFGSPQGQAQPQTITAQLQGQITPPPQQGLIGNMMPTTGGMGGLSGNMMPNSMANQITAMRPQLQAMPQGLGGLAAYGPQAFKEGGSVGLKDAAHQLAAAGRGGDTILAHINPQEAALLKRLGGSGTINPATGLPEFLKIGPVSIGGKGIIGVGGTSLGKIASKFDDKILQPITHGIQDVVQGVAKATGPVGQIAASYFGGPVGAALYAGLSGEDGFNFKRGLMAGAMTWGAQNLAQGLGGTDAAAGSAPVPEPGLASVGVENPASFAGDYSNALDTMQPGAAGSATATPQPTVMGQLGSGNISGAMNTAGQNISNAASNAYNSAASGVTNAINDPASLIPKNALANQDLGTVATNAGKVLGGDTSAFTGSLTKSVAPMYIGSMGMKAVDEMDKFKKEQEELEAKQKEEEARYTSLGLKNLQDNPWQYAAGGPISDDVGIAGEMDGLSAKGSPLGYTGGPLNYAAGGTPRFLSGGGDGMSDSIAATIDGKQPARIADGEFIVPADVVSHLGNGSSKAGAKQLYSMMDKVRTARTGTQKQGKQINPKNIYLLKE